jgi:predicted CopG family antitoxin
VFKVNDFLPKVLNTCTHACMCMGTKTISIMDDAHDLLVRNRMGDESFSEVIRRILGKKRKIMEFAGAWKNVSDKEAERMKKRILDLRNRSTKELIRKYK